MFSWGKQNVFYWLCTTDTWKSINIRTSANHWWDLIRDFSTDVAMNSLQETLKMIGIWGLSGKPAVTPWDFFVYLAKVDPNISINYSYIVCSSWLWETGKLGLQFLDLAVGEIIYPWSSSSRRPVPQVSTSVGKWSYSPQWRSSRGKCFIFRRGYNIIYIFIYVYIHLCIYVLFYFFVQNISHIPLDWVLPIAPPIFCDLPWHPHPLPIHIPKYPNNPL